MGCQTRAGVFPPLLGVGVAKVSDALVGTEPLAALLHPRPKARLDLPWDAHPGPAAPAPLAVELPRTQKGPSCFLRAEPL